MAVSRPDLEKQFWIHDRNQDGRIDRSESRRHVANYDLNSDGYVEVSEYMTKINDQKGKEIFR